ncbi:hypothetical protein BJV82DRAFT_636277 [Fennellomyces sp. T-0311]|nr:hypothetical protein BJV82DRAFT_636277 [Fennellomyces sp. T-0311]
MTCKVPLYILASSVRHGHPFSLSDAFFLACFVLLKIVRLSDSFSLSIESCSCTLPWKSRCHFVNPGFTPVLTRCENSVWWRPKHGWSHGDDPKKTAHVFVWQDVFIVHMTLSIEYDTLQSEAEHYIKVIV